MLSLEGTGRLIKQASRPDENFEATEIEARAKAIRAKHARENPAQ